MLKSNKNFFFSRYSELSARTHCRPSSDPRDRAKGALVGLVVGDALGSPIEFTEKYDHQWITDMEYCRHWDLPAGSWTDDSSLAFCTMEGFMNVAGHSMKYESILKSVADSYVKWLYDGLWSPRHESIGCGCSTGIGIRRFFTTGSLVNGEEEDQGNGTVMKFAPSWFIDRFIVPTAKYNRLSYAISNITHNSSIVRDSISIMSRILDSHILNGRRTTLRHKCRSFEDANNSGWCVTTVDSALWAFQTTHDFEKALIAAVNLGGDADTIGAVCGQIAGSYYGFSAIPDRWVKAIKDWTRVERFIDSFLDASFVI